MVPQAQDSDPYGSLISVCNKANPIATLELHYLHNYSLAGY